MKRILLSHCDADGVGSVIIYEYYKNKNIPGLSFDAIMIIDYGWELVPENITYVTSFDEAILADISAPKEYIDQIRAKGTRVRIYDHHLASDWLKDDPDSIWDDSRSGTRLFWEEYARPLVKRYPPVIRELVERVDTYDRWQEDSPLWEEAKALNSVMYGMKDYKAENELVSNQKFIESTVRKMELFPNEWKWFPAEQRLIDEANERENSLFETAKKEIKIRVDTKGRAFGIFPLGSKISLVCSRILRAYPDMDYVICINAYRGINGKLSFRSKREDLNLNDFVGVQGHAQAAGAMITPEMANRIWLEDYVPVYVDEFEGEWNRETGTPFQFYDQDENLPF